MSLLPLPGFGGVATSALGGVGKVLGGALTSAVTGQIKKWFGGKRSGITSPHEFASLWAERISEALPAGKCDPELVEQAKRVMAHPWSEWWPPADATIQRAIDRSNKACAELERQQQEFLTAQEAHPMAFSFGDLFKGFGQAVSQVGSAALSGLTTALPQVVSSAILPTIRPTMTAGLPAPFVPSQPSSGVRMITQAPMAQTVAAQPAMAAAGPVIRGAALAVRGIKKAIAAFVASARANSGLPWTAGKIKRFAKEFGLTAAATATGLAVVDVAFVALHHKAPRMNPTNIHALRRSMRRIESFHRICQRTDMLRRRGGGRSRGKRGRNGVIIAQN